MCSRRRTKKRKEEEESEESSEEESSEEEDEDNEEAGTQEEQAEGATEEYEEGDDITILSSIPPKHIVDAAGVLPKTEKVGERADPMITSTTETVLTTEPTSEIRSRVGAKATGSQDEVEQWLDALARTPLSSPVAVRSKETTAGDPVASTTSKGDASTEKATTAPVRGAAPSNSAPTAEANKSVAVAGEDEVRPLDIRVAEDSVTEFVPRVCEDANS